MNFYYCAAYEQFYLALYARDKEQRNITIVTQHFGIKQFCDDLNIKSTYYDSTRQNISYIKIFKLLRHLYQEKKRMGQVFKIINVKQGDSFFIPTKIFPWEWVGPNAYLFKKVSKIADVYLGDFSFAKSQKVQISNFNKRAFILEIQGIINWIVFGIKPNIYITGNKYYFGLSSKFILKNKIKSFEVNASPDQLISEVIGKQTYRMVKEEYDNMILYELKSHGNKKISYHHLEEFYSTIFEILNDFAIKEHPNIFFRDEMNQINYPLKNSYNFLPAYIPSEFLFKNIRKNVISFASATLITAAKQEHLKAISLIELIEWKSTNVKKHYRDFLINQEDRILFPKDLDQFRELIYS